MSSVYSPIAIISKLAYRIEEIRHPKARACVLWLVGQYAADDTPFENKRGPEGVADWAPDVLRKAAAFFTKEVMYHRQYQENGS